ncbi:MAG: hypothetical protein M5U26_24500 [Planctomycetota bacterium]|nr:hypothetical protein [Planctomycetota bacterium]
MPVVPGEIYLLDDADARLRDSESVRYVLVLRIEGGQADIAYFSSRFDLFRDGKDIAIYRTWSEFPASGLTMDCYLITDPLGRTKVSKLTHRKGRIGGAFKQSVEDWWGQAL